MSNNCRLIVGLGNPGSKYVDTRHNIGFNTVDKLAADLNAAKAQAKWKSEVYDVRNLNNKAILLKPLTYMNLSGEAVRVALDWLKLDVADMLIVYDDVDLEVGKIRYRARGSAGGHNGIKSIIQHTGTQEFARLKIGVGKTEDMEMSNWVLSSFKREEQTDIEKAIDQSLQGLKAYIAGASVEELMNRYN